MAYDPLNILYGCIGEPQKILMDHKLVDAIDKKLSGKDQIHGLPNLTCIAVFDGKHRHIARAVNHRFVCGFKISVGNSVAIGKNFSCRNMCKSPFYSAVGNLEAALHPSLIGARERHHMFEIVDIIAL